MVSEGTDQEEHLGFGPGMVVANGIRDIDSIGALNTFVQNIE